MTGSGMRWVDNKLFAQKWNKEAVSGCSFDCFKKKNPPPFPGRFAPPKSPQEIPPLRKDTVDGSQEDFLPGRGANIQNPT